MSVSHVHRIHTSAVIYCKSNTAWAILRYPFEIHTHKNDEPTTDALSNIQLFNR